MQDVYVIGAGRTAFGATPGESCRSLFEAAYEQATESVPAGIDAAAINEAVVGTPDERATDRVSGYAVTRPQGHGVPCQQCLCAESIKHTMATTKDSNTLERVYQNRIGEASTAGEVYGYWLFVLGLLAGLVGIGLVVLSNNPGAGIRGGGIALAALGLVLLLIGQIIRLPLKRTATTLSLVGAAIAGFAVAWFAVAFSAGNWSAAFTDSETLIIGLYGLGVLVMAVGSIITPLVTGRDKEQAAAEARAGEAEAERDAAVDEIDRRDEADARAAAIGETDQSDKVDSQSQFELYTDRGGETRWRLHHNNGNIIADCAEGYSSRRSAMQGLRAVQRDAVEATVQDLDEMDEVLVGDDEGQ